MCGLLGALVRPYLLLGLHPEINQGLPQSACQKLRKNTFVQRLVQELAYKEDVQGLCKAAHKRYVQVAMALFSDTLRGNLLQGPIHDEEHGRVVAPRDLQPRAQGPCLGNMRSRIGNASWELRRGLKGQLAHRGEQQHMGS